MHELSDPVSKTNLTLKQSQDTCTFAIFLSALLPTSLYFFPLQETEKLGKTFLIKLYKELFLVVTARASFILKMLTFI